MLGVMTWVAAGFFLVLKVGFLLHRDPTPAPFESIPLIIIAALVFFAGTILLIKGAIQASHEALSGNRSRRRLHAIASEHLEARRLRVAELRANPAKAKYAPLVELGEEWTDENIAYYENLTQTATCVHLQPIERAMRSAGIETKLYRQNDITARCRIDAAALKQAFPLPLAVRYIEGAEGERAANDFLYALLICDEHKQMIYVMHPDEAGAQNAPVFPTS